MSNPKTRNAILSSRAARETNPIPKECWHNALAALKECKWIVQADYVEGWVVLGELGIFTEHGWLEVTMISDEETGPAFALAGDDAQIVDPTYAGQDTSVDKTFYFPGLRVSKAAVSAMTRGKSGSGTKTRFPLVAKDGRGGFANEGYARAYHEAFAYLGQWQAQQANNSESEKEGDKN